MSSQRHRLTEQQLLQEQERFLAGEVAPAASVVRRRPVASNSDSTPSNTAARGSTPTASTTSVGDDSTSSTVEAETVISGAVRDVVGSIVERDTRSSRFEPPSFESRAARAPTLGARKVAFPPPMHRTQHAHHTFASRKPLTEEPPSDSATADVNVARSSMPATQRTANGLAPLVPPSTPIQPPPPQTQSPATPPTRLVTAETLLQAPSEAAEPLYNTPVEVEKLAWIFPEFAADTATGTAASGARSSQLLQQHQKQQQQQAREWRFDFDGLWVSPERAADEPSHSGMALILHDSDLGLVSRPSRHD